MESWVGYSTLIDRAIGVSIVHQALNITNLFTSEISMDPLTIKCNHTINQTEKMKSIL